MYPTFFTINLLKIVQIRRFFIFVIMPDRSPAFLLDFLWYALRHKR